MFRPLDLERPRAAVEKVTPSAQNCYEANKVTRGAQIDIPLSVMGASGNVGGDPSIGRSLQGLNGVSAGADAIEVRYITKGANNLTVFKNDPQGGKLDDGSASPTITKGLLINTQAVVGKKTVDVTPDALVNETNPNVQFTVGLF